MENPRDRGAWWAAVYGVAQSRSPPAGAPLQPPLQCLLQPAASPGPSSQAGGGGETFSLETLDTNFVFLARKISLVWKGGLVVERAGGRSEPPAAEQTLRIRFQRLRPTPSPAAVICARGSVTLRGIKRPAGTGRVQRDSGQRGGLRQRRWFISAQPGQPWARSVCPLAWAPPAGERPGTTKTTNVQGRKGTALDSIYQTGPVAIDSVSSFSLTPLLFSIHLPPFSVTPDSHASSVCVQPSVP